MTRSFLDPVFVSKLSPPLVQLPHVCRQHVQTKNVHGSCHQNRGNVFGAVGNSIEGKEEEEGNGQCKLLCLNLLFESIEANLHLQCSDLGLDAQLLDALGQGLAASTIKRSTTMLRGAH